MNTNYTENDYRLYHHGIQGQKWGNRNGPPYPLDASDHSAAEKKAGWRKSLDTTKTNKRKYYSTSLGAAIAKHQNRKVDKSFKKWRQGSLNRENAIELGKARNAAKIAYESNSTKENKAAYKTANKKYTSALKQNTTYRKGQVKHDVGQDLSRKYLSEAKKVNKQLSIDPQNKKNRSRAIAGTKRAIKIGIKTATFSALVYIGSSYIGTDLSVPIKDLKRFIEAGKKLLVLFNLI